MLLYAMPNVLEYTTHILLYAMPNVLEYTTHIPPLASYIISK